MPFCRKRLGSATVLIIGNSRIAKIVNLPAEKVPGSKKGSRNRASKKGSNQQKRIQEPKALQPVSAETESVDEFMSQLASQLPVAQISLSTTQSTPLLSRPRFIEEQSIDLALADEELNDSLHTMANDLVESTLR